MMLLFMTARFLEAVESTVLRSPLPNTIHTLLRQVKSPSISLAVYFNPSLKKHSGKSLAALLNIDFVVTLYECIVIGIFTKDLS